MNVEKLNQVLIDHSAWTLDYKKGNKANLRGADLRDANLREANLRGADLRDADLRDADLRWADLRGADLRGADLRGADLRGANLHNTDLRDAGIIVLWLPYWTAYVHRETIRIGCQHHPHDRWRAFSNDEINDMDQDATVFWSTYKDLIMNAADTLIKESA